MIVKINDDQSKIEQVRKNINKSFTEKLSEHMPTGFALAVYYSEDIKCRKINNFVIEKRSV